MGIDQQSEEIQEIDNLSGESGQADSIFLVVLNPVNQQMNVIAISRDTMTEIATYDAKGNYIGDSVNHLGLAYAFGNGKDTRAKEAGKSAGLRINPECSTQEGHAIYDPCAPGSRMGTTRAQWEAAVKKHPELIGLLDGIHFHTLCEQDSSDLETTLAAVKMKFGDLISRVKWLNLGGGHHITRPGYDIARLEKCIRAAKEEWKVDVYLEPGEAWALNAGFFLTTVLDVLQNGDTRLAILDGSAACHMPDVLEMPYRPPLLGADEPGENLVTVRLGGPTCLSGDIIGDYSFPEPLAYGDILMFGDMAIYTTCKNNTFNGMPLPDIWLRHGDKTMERLTDFGYEDFKCRLGRRRK